jgi:hypothetical protein
LSQRDNGHHADPNRIIANFHALRGKSLPANPISLHVRRGQMLSNLKNKSFAQTGLCVKKSERANPVSSRPRWQRQDASLPGGNP